MNIHNYFNNISCSKTRFINMLNLSILSYRQNGCRSSKRVDILHDYIKNELQNILPDKYMVKTEYILDSLNSSGKKRCDIVVLNENTPEVVIPVKFIMGNYKQNKNNYFESLTGELLHLKWKNENIKIIPMNIILEKTPYKNKNGEIVKIDCIKI